VDGLPGAVPFDNREYMTYFTKVYNMCTQKPPHNYSEQLYQRYVGVLRERVATAVSPALEAAAARGELLQEVAVHSSTMKKHMVFVKWMKSIFSYLDRFHTKRQALPSLRDLGIRCFYSAALAAALTSPDEPKMYAAILLMDHSSDLGGTLDESLYTLAESQVGDGPTWSQQVTGRELLGTILDGSVGLAVRRSWRGARPTGHDEKELLGNPYLHWELRYYIAMSLFPSCVGLKAGSPSYPVEDLLAESASAAWAAPLRDDIIHSLCDRIPDSDAPHILGESAPSRLRRVQELQVQELHRLRPMAIHELLRKAHETCSHCKLSISCSQYQGGEKCEHCTGLMVASRRAEEGLMQHRLSQAGVFADPWQESAQTSVPWRDILCESPAQAEAIRMARFAAAHRPLQLLLLGALVSRGQDSAAPLVCLDLPVSTDVASKIRACLHTLALVPPLSPAMETTQFRWHVAATWVDERSTEAGGPGAKRARVDS